MVKKKETEKAVKKNKEENIDLESLKEELTKYIDKSIKKEFITELEKSYKRTIREKNKKIIIKNMFITGLLFIIVCLVFIMNKNDYFDEFFIEDNAQKQTKVIKNKETKSNDEEIVEPTLEELKEEYSYLLDNIYINENSSYINDYYNGNLTNELKNYLTLNFLDINSFPKEDNYQIIDKSSFVYEYNKHFKDEYQNKTFNYNGNLIRYINKLDSYLSDDIINKNTTSIIREITDIKVADNIKITTTEALSYDNKLYNIITNEIVSDDINDLLSYQDKLNTVTYIFDKDGKLIDLEK